MRPPGLPKTGGRVKGTPNSKTRHLLEKAEKLGVDPFEILLLYSKRDWQGLGYDRQTETKVLKDGGTIEVDIITPELQLNAAKEACQYLHAKRKAIELSGDDENPVELNLNLTSDEKLALIKTARGV